MEIWRLITTWGAPPWFNMGLDEALLTERDSRPTLRLYSWSPMALSLGYFQKFAEVPAATEHPVVVRRITGGGAIHHDREVTFSIAAPASHPIYRGPIAGSYERVHAVIQEALRQFGVDASLRQDSAVESDRESTGMCFHASTSMDLVWNGRKGVGSAQRRKNGHVLHHGSVKLGTTKLEGEIATIDSVDASVSHDQFATAFVRCMTDAFEIRFERGVPDANERALAKSLGKRYLDPEFVRRR